MKDITVAARNSFELQQANEQLITWVKERRQEWEQKGKEFADMLALNLKSNIDTKSVKAQLARAQRRCVYYSKMASALTQGFTLIPAIFSGETIAVRTDRTEPPSAITRHQGSSDLNMKPRRLPEGDGRYVSPQTMVYSFQDGDKTFWKACDLIDRINLPARMVKQMLLEALDATLGLKLFDEICVAGTGGDPVLYGIIHGEFWYQRQHFLIAWWINTRGI